MASKELIKATSSLTKASQCREDTAILTQAHANWENYLTPAPMSIAFLGELVFISSKQDFSIRDGNPEGGFKFIKYPDSFRACLMQVCNSGWRAFNQAHKSMDQIFLHTQNVPTYIKRTVQILLQNDDVLVKSLLPDTLDSIANISTSCVELAKSVESKFLDVTELITELLETCTCAKQKYGSHLKEVREMLEDEKCKKTMLQEENRQAEEAFNKYGKKLEEANKNFQKAIDSMPSGWDVIGMNFVEGFTNCVNSLIVGATNATIAADSSDTHTKYDTSGSPKDMFATNNIVSKSSMLLAIAQSLVGLIQKDQIEWSKFLDEKTGQLIVDWLKTQIEDVQSNIKDVDQCPVKPQAEKICEQGITICSDLSALAPEGKHDDEAKNKELIQRIRKLMTSAQKFDSSGKKYTKTSAFSVNPPGMSKARSASSGSASQTATENAHFRIEQIKAQLALASEMYEKSLEKMEEKKIRLAETLNKMRQLHVEEIDFDTTIRILAEGLNAMGELQEKWQKMVQFFQMVSNIIDTCLKTSLQDFVKTARNPHLKYDSSMFLKDMIYQQAFQASNIAHLVNMISGTYTEVSSKYLMDRVGSLGRLMALDPKDPRFKAERQIFAASCDDAEHEIKALVLKNKELHKARTKARLEKIEYELNAVLPPPSEKETNKLREIVASGFQDNPEDIDQFE